VQFASQLVLDSQERTQRSPRDFGLADLPALGVGDLGFRFAARRSRFFSRSAAASASTSAFGTASTRRVNSTNLSKGPPRSLGRPGPFFRFAMRSPFLPAALTGR